MSETEKRNENIRRWLLRLALVLFDIFAVNFAYYLALLLRFYVNHQMHEAGTIYMPLFLKFAPYYTVCCIAVFWAFKLYSGMWRYAGLNDVNRIVLANVVTCLIQIFGTLLFVQRMPITYYALGAVIQFVLICASRFSYRLLIVELNKISQYKKASPVNVMIVGVGETARMVLRQFDKSGESIATPVCVIDYRNRDTGWLFNGLPVVGGLESIDSAIRRYKVKSVVIADAVMPAEIRKQVRKRCAENNVEVQDVTAYQQGGDLGFRALLEHTNGPVEIVLDGKAQTFANSEQAAQAFMGKYHVRAVYAKDAELVIELETSQTPMNSVNETWVQEYEKETGEAVSFF